MSTSAGQMLAHFRLVEKLGEGGMGVVWRALDTRLAREVAIKTLPDLLSGHPERLARFEREARALASLNHPNIGQIYGLEQPEGDPLAPPVLVLEYVRGDGLDQRLERGKMGVEEALGFALQIAAGLEAAHELGIIHRDLKPANIRLTPDDTVKILDFGLAKVLASERSAPDSSSDGARVTDWPTVSTDHTRDGSFLGTVGYMSPEQARGKAVDRRTDIWSFGCILFECLTGIPPFPGETVADRIGAILHLEPAWSLLPPATPPAIRDLLRRCLEKDPKRRLRDIGDARLEIERVLAGRTEERSQPGPAAAPAAPAPAAFGTSRSARTALLVLASALAALVLWNVAGPGSFWAAPATPSKPLKLSLNVPRDLLMMYGTLGADGQSGLILAAPRDAKGLPVRDKARLFLRHFDDFELRPVAGSEGATDVVVAPDGRHAYVAQREAGDERHFRIMRLALDGSVPPTKLADLELKYSYADALPNGDLVFLTGEGRSFARLRAGSGAMEAPIAIDTGELKAKVHRLNVLPDGEHAFADAWWYTPRGFHIGVALLHLDTGEATILIDDGGNAQYSPTGHMVFTRADTLYGVRFDLDSLRVEGTPAALMSGVRTREAWVPGDFRVRGNNLVFGPGGTLGRQRTLARARPGGATPEPVGDERRAYVYPPRVSPDGRTVAMVVVTPGALYEIWVADVEEGRFRRLVAAADADCFDPVFSADGQHIAYMRLAQTKDDGIYVRPLAGGPARRVLAFDYSKESIAPLSWSGDRLLVLRRQQDSENNSDVMMLQFGQGTATVADLKPVLTGPASVGMAKFSPDGRLLAYPSDESGRFEIYVAPIAPDGRIGTPVQVSAAGGYAPNWALNGRELYYMAEHDRVFAVPVDARGVPGSAAPLELDMPRRAEPRDGYALSPLPDGSFIYLVKGEDEDQLTHLNVVVNFGDELERRIP